jgi:hypothetical protein
VDAVLRLPRCMACGRCRLDRGGSVRCVCQVISGWNSRPKGRMDGWERKEQFCGARFVDGVQTGADEW